MTDLENIKCKVLPKLADHRPLWFTLPAHALKVVVCRRLVWSFAKADWEGLKAALASHDWSDLQALDAHQGARTLTQVILDYARTFIPKRYVAEHKSTHPWVNDRVIGLVAAKRAAEGTDWELECRNQCSIGIMEEYGRYVSKEREDLQSLPRGVNGWWTKAQRLMQMRGATSSIPALRDDSGKWFLDAESKANLLAATLSRKYKLNDAKPNTYSNIETAPYRPQGRLGPLQTQTLRRR